MVKTTDAISVTGLSELETAALSDQAISVATTLSFFNVEFEDAGVDRRAILLGIASLCGGELANLDMSHESGDSGFRENVIATIDKTYAAYVQDCVDSGIPTKGNGRA